jgi:hypothetical protein
MSRPTPRPAVETVIEIPEFATPDRLAAEMAGHETGGNGGSYRRAQRLMRPAVTALLRPPSRPFTLNQAVQHSILQSARRYLTAGVEPGMAL